MSNIPSQPPRAAPSSASSTADSWHTVASDYSQDPTPSVGSPAEEVITLNPGRQRTTSQGSGATERRKCWVCLTEEGETAPDGTLVNSSRWSKACACSLDAHESCLITWINQTRGPDPNQVITCPQCKEPFKLHQDVSELYKLVSYYNKRIDKIVPYIAGLGIVGGTYVALTVQGWYALCTFCGEDLTLRLFSDQNWSRPSYVIRMLFGLQTIPLWLLASRARYFDSVLPFIPLVFVEQDNVALYPTPRVTLFPTPRAETFPPALTMCVLPWLRIVYNKLWDRYIAPLERKWKDSTTTTSATPQGNENQIILQIEAGEQQEVPQQEPQQPARNRRNNRNGNNNNQVDAAADVFVTMNGTQLCRKVVGAMLLPDVCSLAGFLLGQLPWVKKKIPDRFSRNVLGGILFLVLKDAASVWFKYSAFKSRQSLRVLDYDSPARGSARRR